MLLSPSTKQSDATRPSPDQVLEDLEERVFKDRVFKDRPAEHPTQPTRTEVDEDPIHRPPANPELPDKKAA